MSPKETLEKAYGSIPKEPLLNLDFDFIVHRPIKYYWLKLIRFFTR